MRANKMPKQKLKTFRSKQMKLNIGISEKNLKQGVELLSTILADEMILYIKTRKSHWNVTGESFMELHKLFENQYKQLEESIDEIAERIGKLGEKTIGTMEEFLKRTSLKESPGKYLSSKEILAELLKDHKELKKIPLVFVSGQASQEDMKKAFLVGAHDYIKKPFEIDKLKKTVKTLLKITEEK